MRTIPVLTKNLGKVLFYLQFYYTAFFTKFIQNLLYFYQMCLINKKGGHIL